MSSASSPEERVSREARGRTALPDTDEDGDGTEIQASRRSVSTTSGATRQNEIRYGRCRRSR